ncbi:response regulator transcription factor, partial [Bacillus sp. SIMBA_005]|uniref:response regulator transcription factor n=1 Tax=Bacillus sp. SIMBA_005 TaxID=3085754 RepID=UPI00397AB469
GMANIVIVEDDIFLREELQNILQKEGYSVVSISSFDTPIEDILAAKPGLILLDLNLPSISGFQICRTLKMKGIGPILILTARNQIRDELHAL